MVDGVKKNNKNLRKLLKYMVKIGNKLKIILAQEMVHRLGLMLRNIFKRFQNKIKIKIIIMIKYKREIIHKHFSHLLYK
jgi:hypothetical protein